MVEELLERFSAVVSDVCACLMGFKVRLDQFGREKNQFGCQSVNVVGLVYGFCKHLFSHFPSHVRPVLG